MSPDQPAWRPRGAIVTGAGSGIGAAIAQRLVQDGIDVLVTDIDEERARETAGRLAGVGPAVLACELDVSDPQSVTEAVAHAVERLACLDVLVNNAGVMGPVLPITDYPDDAWRQVIVVDLVGAYQCSKAVVPHLLEAGAGRIVNIASISGKEGNARMTAYAAAKAGLIGFTKALGQELAQTGVLVNCVTPAGTSGTRILGDQQLDDVAPVVPSIPLGRNALPQEVAALVSWLCSAECSFSTGAVFDISGGRATY